jgi:ribosomal protein S9
LVTIRKIELRKQFDIVAIVRGGMAGQVSIQLELQDYAKIDKENRLVLKPFGFLTRDSYQRA